MSNAWTEGYFTEMGYTYHYYHETAPVFQRFCLLLNGLAYPTPESEQEAWHCELGFGQGMSLNINAAANPGRYMGTDFNPAHAAYAQELTTAAGSQAQIFDDSFEQLLQRDNLPQFDSISLHGIWTWVSQKNRDCISEFARRHMKPGGVFYVSYNCFPGWAPAHPLRRLLPLHQQFSTPAGNPVQRIENAVKFSKELLAANPSYLSMMPGLAERWETITTSVKDPRYLAHEYFNQESNCLYFADVAEALSSAKLDYAGTATPLDLIDLINFSEEARHFLSGIEHPILLEQARDYFTNRQFRKDLYTRGLLRLSATEQVERLLNTRLVLLVPSEQVPMKVRGSFAEANLEALRYPEVLGILSADNYAPKTVRHIATQLANIEWAALREMVVVLAAMRAISPCQPEHSVHQVQARCRALNRYLCERSCYDSEMQFLASPVTGGGIQVDRFDQMFLLANERGHRQPSEWVQFAWEALERSGQRISREGKLVEAAEDNIAALTVHAEEFVAQRLPLLRAFGIA